MARCQRNSKRKTRNRGKKGKERGKPRFFQVVPDTPEKWRVHAVKAGVEKKNLGQYKDFESASKITQRQFLLLRAIVKKKGRNEFDAKNFGLQDSIAKSRELVSISTEFKSYLKAIEEETMGGEGHFSEVRNHQSEVLWKGDDDDELTKIDESPINSSFLVLLKAFESMVPNCKYLWRSSKIRFSVTFHSKNAGRSSKKREMGYQAITDGQLQLKSTGSIKALIECKVDKRNPFKAAVDMQEAAQAVAWIKEYPSEERQ